MANSTGSFTVQTNGQTLVVSATVGGGVAAGEGALHLTAAVDSAITQPYAISADTTFYVAVPGVYVISVKQPDGTELWGKGYSFDVGVSVTIAPLPSVSQVASDAGRRLALAPAGAKGETFHRLGTSIGNVAALSTGTMLLVAIDLGLGARVTTATFTSGTTALSVGTNQWFALYDGARALLGQTADDTSTAWGTSTAKTLTFASAITTTYSGLHYLGIMVAATTPPSLRGVGTTAGIAGYAPILVGNSTTGLTDTAPASAATITAGANTPYAYVS